MPFNRYFDLGLSLLMMIPILEIGSMYFRVRGGLKNFILIFYIWIPDTKTLTPRL
jgi:hypothetical protein